MAIVSVSPHDFNPEPGQLYSAGVHPWLTSSPDLPALLEHLEEVARHPQVVAIGECGVDASRGAPMFRQLQVMRRHVELSEELRKPLVVHSVKTLDVVLGLRRDLSPAMPWAIHGFRGKPGAVEMLARAGIYMSFGENFNPEALNAVPQELLLAETDESTLDIEDIISRLSASAGTDLLPRILNNTGRFLEATAIVNLY